MKRIMLVLAVPALLIVGCGASKTFVTEQIAASEARTGSSVSGLEGKVEANAAEIGKLTDLASQLDSKVDMAINKAAGFENYMIIWSGMVNFDYDSFELNDAAQAILGDAGSKMEQVPSSLLELVGHTDRSGASKYNLMLGEMRANSARRFLSDQYGISLYRMFVVSRGEDNPVALADENQAASKNRRVVINLWGPQ